MKLYYSTGACSLSPHIALHEAGLAHDLVKVDLRAKTLADGSDFTKVNPKGQVPALVLDNGEVLTEGPAVVQWIADQAPAKGLAPANGTPERYRLQEWLNFVSTDLHKSFGPLFNPAMPEEAKTIFRNMIMAKLKLVEQALAGKDYLMGNSFTVVDGYLFTLLTWAEKMKFDLSGLPNVTAFKARVAARPAVQAALQAEAAKA
ncbi:MAG: glutathione transferase GstA [Afipia sp.]|nr:glutathione transferase GstA [Afipia sp.]OJW65233.1 MAG: glutathione transferase GstA [Afipia sp. 64-13]